MKIKKEWKIRVVSKYHKNDLSICGIFLLKECKDSEECDDNIMLLLQSKMDFNTGNILRSSSEKEIYDAQLLDENGKEIAYFKDCKNLEHSDLYGLIEVAVSEIDNKTNKFNLMNELRMEYKYKDFIDKNNIDMKKSDSD